LSGHDSSDRAAWIAIQRSHFRRFLDGLPSEGPTGLGAKIQPALADEISKTLTSAHDMLFLLLQQGMLLMNNPRPQAKGKFLASWQRLQNILASCKPLHILGLLWMFETQQKGDDLASLLALADRYRGLFSTLRDEFDQSA